MKPIKLTIQAFGPFSGKEQIDFTRLGTNPLFLINGPTGAGKSSILDAICFALYGQTTGAEREAAQMRCDHTADALLTEIVFDFSLADKHYRVRRIPSQERPKARGDGTTTQLAEAQLWHLNGTEEGSLIVPKSVTDANNEIKSLVGLDVEQFRQVMVLPQGKFRDLLMADSKEREKIFGQLFQTRIYRQIEDRLKERASGIRKAVETHQNKIKGILEGADVSSEQALDHELEGLQPELSTAADDKQKAEQEKNQASHAKQQALDLLKRFEELSRKERELIDKQEQQPDIDAKQHQLKQSIYAQKIKPSYMHLQQKQEAVSNNRQQIQEVANSHKKAHGALLTAESTLRDAQKQAELLDGLKHQQLELRQYEVKIDELVRARAESATSKQAAEDSQKAYDNKLHSKQELTEEQQSKEAELTELNKALESLAPQQIRLNTLERQLASRNELESLRNQHRNLAEKENTAKHLFETKTAEWEDAGKAAKHIEWQWHSTQAAQLARELQEGEPCPVCGSQAHPSPAQAEEGLEPVSNERLEKCREAVSRAQAQASEAKQAWDVVRHALEQNLQTGKRLSDDIGELADQALSDLQATFDQAQRDVANLKAQEKARTAVIERIGLIKEKLKEIDAELNTLQQKSKEDNDRFIAARTSVETVEKQVPEQYREKATLGRVLDNIGQSIAGIEQALSAAEDAAKARRSEFVSVKSRLDTMSEQLQQQLISCEAADAAWQKDLAESSFESLEDFLQAQLDPQQQEELKSAIDDFHSQLNILQGALEVLRDELSGKVAPGVDALERRLTEKSDVFDMANQRWQALCNRHDQLRSVKQKLTKAHQTNAELEAQYAIYGTLSDVANGQTGNKISLQRFVLSVLLDDVLIQATQRLNIMSKGRYQLLRKEDRTKGNRASGLELEVEDSYSGKTRAVATLSGGESFMAALSLALGLSDVVQSYAGGIRLDTLFIDEGFGSLDQESLDLAIRTLIDLQASGRTIGIISHVSELKEQMSQRIDVLGSRSGSTISTVAA